MYPIQESCKEDSEPWKKISNQTNHSDWGVRSDPQQIIIEFRREV